MWSQEIACEYVRGLVGFMDSFNGGLVASGFASHTSAVELVDLVTPVSLHLHSPLNFLTENVNGYGMHSLS